MVGVDRLKATPLVEADGNDRASEPGDGANGVTPEHEGRRAAVGAERVALIEERRQHFRSETLAKWRWEPANDGRDDSGR
jgi:hypothetical protein